VHRWHASALPDRLGQVVTGVGVRLQYCAAESVSSQWSTARPWPPVVVFKALVEAIGTVIATATASRTTAAPRSMAVCSAQAIISVPVPCPGGRASRAFISGDAPSSCRTSSYLEAVSTVHRPASSPRARPLGRWPGLLPASRTAADGAARPRDLPPMPAAGRGHPLSTA
jgi:hypothetical protein